MRRYRRNRGTTMVELAVAMASAAVIITGSTVAVGTGAYLAAQAQHKVAVGRDACVALRLMQGVLRGVDHTAITISNKGATLTLDTGAYFTQSGGSLTYYNGSSSMTVLSDLSSLSFSLVPGTSLDSYQVTVALNLSSAGRSLNTQSTIYLRN